MKAQFIFYRRQVIILDEPTVGPNPLQIIEIRQLIKQPGRICISIPDFKLALHFLSACFFNICFSASPCNKYGLYI